MLLELLLQTLTFLVVGKSCFENSLSIGKDEFESSSFNDEYKQENMDNSNLDDDTDYRHSVFTSQETAEKQYYEIDDDDEESSNEVTDENICNTENEDVSDVSDFSDVEFDSYTSPSTEDLIIDLRSHNMLTDNDYLEESDKLISRQRNERIPRAVADNIYSIGLNEPVIHGLRHKVLYWCSGSILQTKCKYVCMQTYAEVCSVYGNKCRSELRKRLKKFCKEACDKEFKGEEYTGDDSQTTKPSTEASSTIDWTQPTPTTKWPYTSPKPTSSNDWSYTPPKPIPTTKSAFTSPKPTSRHDWPYEQPKSSHIYDSGQYGEVEY